MRPLYDPEYDRLWAVLEELEIPVNAHGGTGSPDYGRYASVPMIMISEVPFYSQRPFVHMTLGGVFERFPRLKFVMTEMGAAWIPPLLKQLDGIIANVKKGEIGELKYTKENQLARGSLRQVPLPGQGAGGVRVERGATVVCRRRAELFGYPLTDGLVGRRRSILRAVLVQHGYHLSR